VNYPPRNVAVDWLETIWRTGLNHHCKYLACYLRSFMNAKNDVAWPSYSRMVAETGLTKPTISKYLSELESEGWISINRGHQGKNSTYTITFPEGLDSKADLPVKEFNQLNTFTEVVKDVGEGSKGRLHELNKELNNELNNIKTASPNGSRFNPDFELPVEWISFSKTERPELDPQTLFDQFRDYWIAVPGAKGRKADWFATWRNWVRNQKSFGVNHGQPKQPVIDNSAAGRVRAAVARAREQDRQQSENSRAVANDGVDVRASVG
jgi:DNA-binding PadR family transcriptional regulator